MKSLVMKAGGAAACLAAALCSVPYMSSSSGQSVNSSVVMASANETETSASQSAIFESSSNPESTAREIANIIPPDSSTLAQLANDSQQKPLTPNNPTVGNLSIMGTERPTEQNPIGGGAELQRKAQPSKVIPFVKPSGPLPNWMVDGGTLAQEENAAREQVRKLLRNKVTPDFNGTPLQHVIASFAASANVPILIDISTLEAAGVASPEDPVTLGGIGEISLQRALKLILAPKELQYVVEPEHIVITTKDQGSARNLRTYDLAHLVPSSEWLESIIHLIQTTIRGNWDVDGGEDTLQPFGSMLVANCPEEVHLGIEGLLFELSKMNKDNLK